MELTRATFRRLVADVAVRTGEPQFLVVEAIANMARRKAAETNDLAAITKLDQLVAELDREATEALRRDLGRTSR